MSFFFALIFMILVFWRPQEWLVPGLYGFPILDIVTAIACLGFLVECSEKRARIPAEPATFLFAGILVSAMMSHVANTYLAGMVAAFSEVWKLSFFCILLFSVTDRPSRLRAIAMVFVSMACVMSVHALLQQKYGYGFAQQMPLLKTSPGSDEYSFRSLFFGIFGDPNDLAQILATGIPFAFVLTRMGGVVAFVIGAGITALLISGILATQSRGGLLALLASVAVGIIQMVPRRWLWPLLLMMAVGALGLCPYAGPFLDESAHDRVVFWGQANYAFKQNPLFGVGYGMISDYVQDDRAIHNAFVLCYSELGLFGYWVWVTLLVAGVVGSWRVRNELRNAESTDARYVARFAGLAIAATSGFMVSSYFLSRAYQYPLFFLLVGLNAVPMVAQALLPDHCRRLSLSWREVLLYGTVGTFGSLVYVYISIVLLNKAYA
ncbi:MAG: O-antigen ligase family protein [bacterium]